jgi:ankyrin
VTRLLLARGAGVDTEGKNGVTPLHVAAHYEHQNVALELLQKVKIYFQGFVIMHG